MDKEAPLVNTHKQKISIFPWSWPTVMMVILAGIIIGGLISPFISQSSAYNAPPTTCDTNNLASNKNATASSFENNTFPASKAVDEDGSSRWSSAFSDIQWLQIDLGSKQALCQVVLKWEAAYGKTYQLQISDDTKTWSSIYTTASSAGGTEEIAVSGSGRYVRIAGTKRGTPYGYSLFEVQVFGTSSNGGDTLLSARKPATSSSIQNDHECVDCNANKAIDGDTTTRWSTAFSDPQWLQVDLSETVNVHKVILNWEAAYGKAYQLQISADAKTWITIYTTTKGTGGIETIEATGTGRYIRLNGTGRGTPYGYSLFEFQVFGTRDAGTNPDPTPTSDPSKTPTATATPPSTNGDWKQIWSDEFNAATGNKQDSSKWTPAIGNLNDGWGNKELEYYTDNNATHDGKGNLIIEARKETAPNSKCWYGTCQYTSSRLITQNKFTFTHGRVEARIKIPSGQGIWPSIWMMGNDIDTAGWPNNGEVDIFENIGREPGTVHGTIHGPNYSGANGIGGAYTMPNGAHVSDDYHIFAVEWNTNQISFFFDGKNYFTVTRATVEQHGKWVYDHPFYILLNVAVGGSWPGDPNGSSTFPQRMSVDYIRVFQHA